MQTQLGSYLESHPKMIALHGTLTDGEPMGIKEDPMARGIAELFGVYMDEIAGSVLYGNPFHPKTWQEKIEQAVQQHPHIAAEIVPQTETELYSPIGLVLSDGIITDIGHHSIVKENGERILSYNELEPLERRLKSLEKYGEALIKDPVFSALYLQVNHPYSRDRPELMEDTKAQAEKHNLKHIVFKNR